MKMLSKLCDSFKNTQLCLWSIYSIEIIRKFLQNAFHSIIFDCHYLSRIFLLLFLSINYSLLFTTEYEGDEDTIIDMFMSESAITTNIIKSEYKKLTIKLFCGICLLALLLDRRFVTFRTVGGTCNWQASTEVVL